MPVYPVSQITAYLQASLESDDFLRDLWVSGEVSNLSAPASGHLYFTLKDSSGQLRCVMFRSHRGRDLLEKGAAVLAHGAISFYQVRGDIQFYVDLVQPSGMGELALKLEQLKVKLEEEGLFAPSRKRALPPFPQKVAVVTSPTGAAWHDIQNVVRRRYPLVELALAPTPVQGDQAAGGIVEALQAVNAERDVDVVIVARGGGALEELWPFNEEVVARAIYASRVPVVSGVGHETDVTIADLVADLRAPTPSAAAELVVPDRRQLQTQVIAWERDAEESLVRFMEERQARVEEAQGRLRRAAPDVRSHRQRIDELLGAAQRSLRASLALRGEQSTGLLHRLEALNPAQVLARGYAVVQRADTAEVVARASQVGQGDPLQVTVQDGAFLAEVTGAPAPQGTPEKASAPSRAS